MATVVLDIETIPVQDPRLRELVLEDVLEEHEAAVRAVRAPGNYKDQAKIDAYILDARGKLDAELEATKARALAETSLDGLGQVCVVGYAIDDEPVETIIVANLSAAAERRVLEDFFAELRELEQTFGPVTLVGHNLIGFDVPFLRKRAAIHRVRPPRAIPRDPKPWGEDTFDTMREWAGARGYITLRKLARILGLKTSSSVDGADVARLVAEGKIEEVAAKCRADVEMTREVWRILTHAPGAHIATL